MMLFYGLIVISCSVHFIEMKPKSCENLTKHKNYHLLPQKPNCGRKPDAATSSIVGTRIHNGTKTFTNEYPWVVLIEWFRQVKPDPEEPETEMNPFVFMGRCIGSLINKNYVLTGGQCIQKQDVWSYLHRLVIMIRHHERDFPDFPCSGRECIPKLKEYRISEFLHYDDEENIGLVRLLTPVQFSEFVTPICLPLSCFWEIKDFEAFYMWTAGRGVTDIESYDILPPEIDKDQDNPFTSTQKLKVVGVSHEECVKRWAGEQNISVYKVCATQAEDQSGAPCLGDKGSPLMLEEFEEDMTTHYLVGILSFSWGCTSASDSRYYPLVFAKVSHFARWILDNIKE